MGGYNQQILDALKFVGQLKQSRQEQALQQQRLEEERQARQAEIDFRHDQLQQQKDQFDAQLQLQQKAVDLQHVASKAQIADIINRGGTIPGDVVQANYPPIAGTAGAFPGVGPMPDVTQQPTTLRHTINDENGNPIMTMDLAPPEVFAQQQANLERIAKAPEEERKTREEAAKQQAESLRQIGLEQVRAAAQLEQHKADIAQAAQERNALQQIIQNGENARKAMDIEERHRDNMNKLTGGMYEFFPDMFGGKGPNAANSSIVKLNPDGTASINATNVPSTYNSALTNLFNGRQSLEELEKVNPEMKQGIATLAGMNGIGDLSKDDIARLRDLQLEMPAMDLINQIMKIKQSSPLFGVNVPFFNSKFNELEKEIDSRTAQIAIQQSGSKRQSDADLKRIYHGLVPSRALTQLSNDEVNKLNDFVRSKMDEANSIVQKINNPDQRNAILTNWKIPQMGQYMILPGDAAHPQTSSKQPIINIPQILQNLGGRTQAPIPPATTNIPQVPKPNPLGPPVPRKQLPNAPIGEVNVYDRKNHVYGHIHMKTYAENPDQFDIIPNKEK